MQNVTEAFVDYLFDKSREIGTETIKKARQCKEDYLAVTTAGAAKNREKWRELLDSIPEGNARLFGYEKRADSHTAALVNGFNAHSLELDDGQRFAMIHLGAAVISAIEAASADCEVCVEDYLKGIVMGYEAACRASIAMQPSHKQRGYHAAGTCGTIGAAVGVGFALRMGRSRMKRVLTAAAGSAAGLLEIQEQQSELKPFNLGRAAMDGLTAAYMGRAEFESPEDMLGGERGFFSAFSDAWDLGKLTEKQDYFEICRIYVKPYASCRHSHSAVEAALRLRGRIALEEIDRVEVETYRLGVRGHDHREIKSVASAKLSTPYSVAAALLYGRADLSVFEPLDENAILLARKITVTENTELTGYTAEKRAAVVRVLRKNGTEEYERVDYAKGEPENPMTDEELAEKWESLYEYSRQRH